MLDVPESTKRNSVLASLRGLVWPLLLGSATTSVFYILVFRGALNQPLMHRYFAGHPVSYFETAMFFIGLCALLLKLCHLLRQSSSLWATGESVLPQERAGDETPKVVHSRLEKLSAFARESYLGRRLHDALRFLERQVGNQGLDEELKYLADQDQGRQHDSYALVRIIIWATPMLGFLGTVIGITQALGDLDGQELSTNIQNAMDGLLAGLYIAFDTTALALSLSIVLMFLQFLVDRIESQLLASVDELINDRLLGRFESQEALSSDPQVAAIQRMGHAVITATEQLVKRQTRLWQSAMEESQNRWGELVAHSSEHLQSALEAALARSLKDHAAGLAESSRAVSDQTHQVLTQWRATMVEHAQTMQRQQSEFVRQGQVMTQVIEATGKIASLEGTLNKNLQALSGAKNFEDTVMSLAAAIHLLTTRLEQRDSTGVELTRLNSQGRAA
jgi:biopolymer transport protein ExbB/TolQ